MCVATAATLCVYTYFCTCRCQDKGTILAEIESRTKIELGQQKLDIEKAVIEDERKESQLAHERALATAESGIKFRLAEARTEAEIAQIQADMKIKMAEERTRQYEIEREIQEKESERQKLVLREFTTLREAGKDVHVDGLIKLLQAVKIKSRFNIQSENSRCAKFTRDVWASKSNNTTNWMCASAKY